jgi:hypothetical protein
MENKTKKPEALIWGRLREKCWKESIKFKEYMRKQQSDKTRNN